ncbi:unnamed protein product [Clonostachys byssicola]|uniref:Choline transport protein n=1 Tax=Clonostachys byssicola TaxID=160290 RepID=A0A9N9UCY2_9HYPO|nr:unnamed protein product [Clonostachys byssicola]
MTKYDTQTDEAVLARLGHEQELRREFSLLSLTALVSCLMGTWEATTTGLNVALASGGPPCVFFNFLLCFLSTICITLSLGEIASIYPTAGGQYHWVAALSPTASRAAPAWATGWISIGGQLVFGASAAFAAGLQFQGVIIMNNDNYVPERWHGLLLYWAVLVYCAVTNIWGIRILPHTNIAIGVVHIAAFIGVVAVLLAMSDKTSASSVFVEVQNQSGWDSDALAWLVGLISAVYPFLGYDAACHLSEELPHASRNVPLAMMGAVISNGLTGLVFVLSLLFSATNLGDVLSTSTGFPYMEIYLEVTRSHAGATVLALVTPFIGSAASAASLASTSRTLWAFARDKATPFDRHLSKVDDKLKVPVHSVVAVLVFQAALGLIYLGSTAALNAILSMAAIGMYLSYILPIIYMLVYGRRRHETKRSYRYLRLPDWLGVSLNVVSIVWIVLVIIFSTFPSTMPVTAETMNYSIVVLAGWLVFGVVYYLTYGRHKFEAPVSDVSVISATRQ